MADCDVVIVGAGLSGLVCARRLLAAGRDVLVVEARRGVGGRLRTLEVDGGRFDLGGQWMSAGQPRLARLAAELGVAAVPQYRDGEAVLALTASPPRRLMSRAFAALARRRQLAGLSKAIARRAPIDPGWDALSLGEWLERSVPDPVAREQVTLHAELTFAASPHDLSLFGYVANLAAQDGRSPFAASPPGGGEHRFVGGAQRLADSLAAALGERVCLATPVGAIQRDDDGVTVATSRGPLRARRAVIAVPPVSAAAIGWDPPLPPAAARVMASSRPGAVVKIVATYARAFWRAAGLSGEAYQATGWVRGTVDGAAPEGRAALVAFVVGDWARRWDHTAEHERREQVIAELVGLFGEEAAGPRALVAMDWSGERWSRGCVAGLPPGAAVAAPAWRGPFGRVHIAGTESATSWPGFMEGAIDAGLRAADEVLAVI